MEALDAMQHLAQAYEAGSGDRLSGCLAPDCTYYHMEQDDTIEPAGNILHYFSNGIPYEATEDAPYSCRIVPVDSIWAHKDKPLPAGTNPYAILLYQYSRTFPIGVVVATMDANRLIKGIQLERDRTEFNVEFLEEADPVPGDNPKSVTAFSRERCDQNRNVRMKSPKEPIYVESGKPHVWVSADEFIRRWMQESGFFFRGSKVCKDCVGYHFTCKGKPYTLYGCMSLSVGGRKALQAALPLPFFEKHHRAGHVSGCVVLQAWNDDGEPCVRL